MGELKLGLKIEGKELRAGGGSELGGSHSVRNNGLMVFAETTLFKCPRCKAI